MFYHRLLITLLLTCLSLGVFAQKIIPFAGIELYESNNILFQDRLTTEIRYNPGDMAFIYGLSCPIKNFEVRISAETLMYINKLTSYTPTHSEYKISLGYTIKNIHIKVEHMCVHSIQSYPDNPTKVFGGYDKIGIYWNFKP